MGEIFVTVVTDRGKIETLWISVHRTGLFEHLLDLRGQKCVVWCGEARVFGQQGGSFALRGVEGAGVVHQIGDLEGGQAVLAAPEEVAGAARFQIVLCHGEAVCRGAEEFEPLLDRLARVVADEEAPALRRTAAHPAAQLVQSAQAVALGVLDDHDRCVRHIHADFDDGGGDQRVQLPGLEVLHDGGFFLWLELAVHQADPAVGQQRLGDVFIVGLHGVQPAVGGVLDGGADDIHLPPGVDLPVKEAVEVPPLLPGDAPGLDRLAARRQFVEDRDVEV